MNTIDEFAQELRSVLQEKTDKEVNVVTTKKNNGVELTGIAFKGEDNISPVMYIDQYFYEYLHGADIESISDDVLYTYNKTDTISISDEVLSLNKSLASRLYVVAINYEQNKDIVKRCPHEKINDLVLIPRILVSSEQSGRASALLTYDILDRWKMSSSELMAQAKSNTVELFPPVFVSMKDMMQKLMGDDMVDETPYDMNMYVMTNETGINGAAMIAYPDIIAEKLSEAGIDRDCYIIPSSVHEILILDMPEPEEDCLRDMVKEVNSSVVSEQDFLSNNIYKLNFAEKEISIVGKDREIDRER